MNIDSNKMTAHVSNEENANNALQQIMQDIVSEGSVDRYNSGNTFFLIWVFNDDALSKQLIHYWFIKR